MSKASRDELPTEELRTAELNWISAERTQRRRRTKGPKGSPKAAGAQGLKAAVRDVRTRFQLRGR